MHLKKGYSLGHVRIVVLRAASPPPSLFVRCQGPINRDNAPGIGIYREELLRHWYLEAAALLGDGDSSSLLSFLRTG